MRKNEKGILTIEASIVLCAFTLLILFLFNFATVYRAQNMVSHAALQTADAVALESYARETSFETDAQNVLFWANRINGTTNISEDSFESLRTADLQTIAREKFILAIGENSEQADTTLRSLGVKNGLNGIDFSQSYVDLTRNDVIVKTAYTIKLRFPVFGAKELQVTKAAKAKTAGEILFALKVVPEAQIMGTAQGSGKYRMGTEVMIYAEPNYGYDFVSWNDGNTENPRKVTITGAQTYTAMFKRHSFGVNLFIKDSAAADDRVKGSNAYGTVSAVLNGTESVGGGEYSYETDLKVKVQTNPGYKFLGWTGSKVTDAGTENISRNNTEFDVHVNGIYDLTAAFEPYTYTISVTTDCDAAKDGIGVKEKGTADSYKKSVSVKFGKKVLLKANGNLDGYTFEGWYLGDSLVSRNANVELDVPVGDKTYTAKYTKDPILTLVASGYGTVKIVSNGKTQSSVKRNTDIQIQATPQSGYYFAGWSDNGAAKHTVKINADTTFTATFKKLHSVTVATSGSGTASGGGTSFKDGDTTTLKASPSTGYHFVRWEKSVDGGNSYASVSNQQNISITVNASVHYRACFEINVYTVTFDVNGGSGSIPSRTVKHGETISGFQKPVPNGSQFVSWQLNGNNVTSVTVTSNITLKASWTRCSGHVYGQCGQRHWLDQRHNGYWNPFGGIPGSGAGHSGWGSGHYQYFRTCCVCVNCGVKLFNLCGSCTSWKNYTWVNTHGLSQMDNIWSNS